MVDRDIEDGNRLYIGTAGKLSLTVSRGREFLFQVLAFKITLF